MASADNTGTLPYMRNNICESLRGNASKMKNNTHIGF
jgi:hypothetical protein